MFFKNIIAVATVALFAGQAMSAVMIAPDPISACNCPNNCQHKVGSSCKFYSQGNTLSGECQLNGNAGNLICIA
ncbi:hypothetical protein K505DRAFT_327945 [Melanomma pulvis-pyrius CBS 109.77]|uniref:Extracellular membrane protein CFEM domain-containing protein n=1 Tax=Melanomma pulvis-pyrius CBS 109.77 TaxID=1314802 RepID=A0A6A6X100_9PLEO|nr:hypothetical protein K505DRAFT_327945 [Melanomma pulvis-pyrius CBS 109.77]